MSTLQISLGVAGAVILAAVVAHGAWTSRKSRPKQATPENRSAAGPSGTLEPSFSNPLDARREPALDATRPLAAGQGDGPDDFKPRTVIDKKAVLDGLLAVIAPPMVEQRVSG